MLSKYISAKNFLKKWRKLRQFKQDKIEEFELKKQWEVKLKVIRAWRREGVGEEIRKRKILKAWRDVARQEKEDRVKERYAMQFFQRLMKQKVVYVLYKFTQ